MFASKINNIFFYIFIIIFFYLCVYGIDAFGSILSHWYPNITNYIIYDVSRVNPQGAFDEPFNKFHLIFFDISFALLLFYFVFIYFFNFFLSEKEDIFHIRIIWTIKCIVSFFVILLYELNFGLDQNMYYFLSVNNVNAYSDNFGLGLMSASPTFLSNSNMVNLLRYINFFTLDSWFSIKIFFALLYMLTIINFYKLINIYNNEKKIITLYLLSLLPSFMLFTSIITKDAIILCLTSFIFLKAIEFKKNQIYNFILISIFLILIYMFRKWMGLFLISSFFGTIFIIYFYKLSLVFRFISFSILIILLYLALELLNSKLDLTETKDFFAVFYRYIMAANYLDGHISLANQYISDTACLSCQGSRSLVNKSNLLELIIIYPKMMFMSIFSPFIFDLRKMTYLIPILENIFVLSLFVLSFFNLKRKYIFFYLYLLNLVLIFTLAYAVINYLNIGNSFRYSLFMRYILYVFAVGVNLEFIEKIILYVYKKIKNFRRPYIKV